MPLPTFFAPASPAWFAHRVGGVRHLGVLDPDGPVAVDCGPHDELGLLAAGGLGRPQVRGLLRVGTPLLFEDIVFDIPIERPGKLLCLGKNFAAHAREFGAEVPEEPIFFTKLPDTLLPHGGTVVLPHWLDERIDHEVELGVVLGFDDPQRSGRKYVTPEEAAALIAGYTVINDVTARTMQGLDRGRQQPWLRSKSFDTFGPIGPWVVPAETFGPEPDLAIELHVGDVLRQSSRTSHMVVHVPEAIAYLSRHTTLRPGDILAMGTPEGVGPIAAGDVMTASIEGIGCLQNRVAREAPPHGGS
jgi:2-keto-4-pentenoate hydratase/2-oxohepta-3-ene-1,7-dioic acid hydratase in catechol pathway